MQVFLRVVSLFLIMLCGFFSTKARLISKDGIGALNRVVLYFSLPFMSFVKLQRDADPALLAGLTQVFLLGGAAIMLCGGMAALLFMKEEAKRKAVFTNMCMFSNSGFMGFPVLTAAFGADSLIYGVIYVAVFNILNWTFGVMIFDKKSVSWRKLFINPCLIASVLGIICFAARIRLPGFINSAMELMGDTTTPLALFIIGARLDSLSRGDFKDVKLLSACALRLIVFPLVIYALTRFFPMAEMARSTIVLLTAMPAATTLALQAESCGGDAELSAKGVALSTALSIVTIPLILLLPI